MAFKNLAWILNFMNYLYVTNEMQLLEIFIIIIIIIYKDL